MSKQAVSEVYARIIKDVCENSRVDFEEGGVDLAALELLRQGWQKKLSAFNLGAFPWDPKPEPPAKVEAAPAPSHKQAAAHHPAVNGVPNGLQPQAPQVKQEQQPVYPPQAQPVAYNGQQYAQGQQQMTAQQRAANHLQQRFGDQATPQIAQLQGGVQPQHPPGQPYIKQEEGQDYRQQYPQQVPLKAAQTDGAADSREEYEAELAARRAGIAQDRVTNDRIIYSQYLASQNALQGGGLLMPLDQHVSVRARARPTQSTDGQESSLSRAQGDAAGDDEEDEDAINSDLDDPDDLNNGENDEENVDNVMLCTYDKVQRVKNKWKCTLKDGVFRTRNADYVFHKGQGEFEW